MPDISGYIAQAAEHELTLRPNNFRVLGGEVTIDGMEPAEWIAAMTNAQGTP